MKKKNLLVTVIVIFGLAKITIAQVPSYVPINGLVGWWPFNGNANDESGNANNGTVNGATLTSDRFGAMNSAFSFNGISDYIEMNNGGPTGTGITLCYWYKSQISAVMCAFGYGGTTFGTSLDIPHNLSNSGTCLGPAVHCYGTFINPGGNNLPNPNQWHNVIVVIPQGAIDLSMVLVYLDGSLMSGTCSFLNNAPNLNIGNTYPIRFGYGSGQIGASTLNYFDGMLDDFGIWNRSLTQQEITDLYNGCSLSVNTQPTNQTVNINNSAQFVVSSSDPVANYQWQTDLGVGFQNLNSVGLYSGTLTNTLTVSNVTLSNNNQPFRCLVSSGSCSDTSNVAILTVNNNVGINETSQDNLFSVFPNPAQSIINVKADSKLIGAVYSIYDNMGKIVLTGKLNSQNTTIELGNLSGGIYMFSVGENMKQTFKVIKE